MRVDTPDNDTNDDEVSDLTAGDIPEGEDSEEERTDDDYDSNNHADAANLTLGDISLQTGFPYVTVARYARENRDRLPGEGSGKARRYYPQAVEMIRELKAEAGARRGRGQSEETTHESESETTTTATRAVTSSARSARKPRKAPRAPRVRRTPAIPTAAALAKRSGRPRKNPDAPAVAANMRRRVAPRHKVVTDTGWTPPKFESATAPSSSSPAETAYRRAHLTAKLESLQDVMAHLAREHENLQAEIAKLS